MDHIFLNIVLKRKELGYSQEVMAQELKISQSHYNRIEKNKTPLTVQKLSEIAAILDTSPGALIGSYIGDVNAYKKKLDEQYNYINELKTKNDALEKDLKNARKLYRSQWYLLVRIRDAFLSAQEKTEDDEITMKMLDDSWNKLKKGYNPFNEKEMFKYRLENPEGSGAGLDSLMGAVIFGISNVGAHIAYLNKNTDLFGFNDDLMS